MPAIRTHLRAAIAALAAAILVAGGAAGYWTGGGGGSATAQLPVVQPITFSPGTPSHPVYPGGVESVATVARNPNDFAVHVPTLVLDPDGETQFSVDAEHGGCDVSALSFVPQDNGGDGWEIPPRAGSDDGTLAIDLVAALAMDTEAADACQGATFTIRLLAGE